MLIINTKLNDRKIELKAYDMFVIGDWLHFARMECTLLYNCMVDCLGSLKGVNCTKTFSLAK